MEERNELAVVEEEEIIENDEEYEQESNSDFNAGVLVGGIAIGAALSIGIRKGIEALRKRRARRKEMVDAEAQEVINAIEKNPEEKK